MSCRVEARVERKDSRVGNTVDESMPLSRCFDVHANERKALLPLGVYRERKTRIILAEVCSGLGRVDLSLCSKPPARPPPQAARASASSLTAVIAIASSPLLNDAR